MWCYLIVVLFSISLMTNDVDHLFNVLINCLFVFLMRCLLKFFFSTVFIFEFLSCCWVIRFFYVFWIQFLCHRIIYVSFVLQSLRLNSSVSVLMYLYACIGVCVWDSCEDSTHKKQENDPLSKDEIVNRTRIRNDINVGNIKGRGFEVTGTTVC